MPDRIAERLLRLIASREVASTIAGDLQEIAATRGHLWFWFAVVRTVPSLLWRDLTSEPWFLMRLGLRGLLVTVCLGPLISFITLGLVFRLGHSAGLTNPAMDIAFTATSLCTIALVQFITGLHLARHSRGREVSSVFAYIGVYNVLRLGTVLIEVAIQSSKVAVSPLDIAHGLMIGALGHGRADQFAMVVKFVPLFLGALAVRFRSRHVPSNTGPLLSVVRL